PPDEHAARGARPEHLERGRQGDGNCGAAAAVADRPRTSRDLCRHPRRERQTPRRPHPMGEPVLGRRLDRHRTARDAGRRDPFGHPRRRTRDGCRMTMVERLALDKHIASSTRALLDAQKPDGHWCFELEADATIPAEYVLLRHYLAEPVDA